MGDRARELLAAEYEADGATYKAREIRLGEGMAPDNLRALRAIEKALALPADDDADDAEFELHELGMMVAGTSGPRADAMREIMHYAAVYGQDGPAEAYEVFEVIRRPIAIAALPTPCS